MSIVEFRKKLMPLCEVNGISYLAVFGSYARGEDKRGSDLDLLVKFGKKVSLFDLVGIERDLSKEMGLKLIYEKC